MNCVRVRVTLTIPGTGTLLQIPHPPPPSSRQDCIVVMVSHLPRREIHVGAVAVVIHRGSSCGMALGDFLNRVIAQFVLNFQVLGGRAQIAQIQGLCKGA
ncbi:hypothetical protein N656DRAFT_777231 [Canariomyces notabilis]|uniref:Uncharacterized protein n=1 Tax=Canariomyces notabilis TaxID=2074819 RepID=A0AAN6TGP6_9PEZI|nr:hypothetical protein N656DRAFT_777231 [Canariomyces arenarius]